MAYTSSSRLSADLGRACVDKEGADVNLVARDRSRFSAHKAVLACRSPVLSGFLTAAAAAATTDRFTGTYVLHCWSRFACLSYPVVGVSVGVAISSR